MSGFICIVVFKFTSGGKYEIFVFIVVVHIIVIKASLLCRPVKLIEKTSSDPAR